MEKRRKKAKILLFFEGTIQISQYPEPGFWVDSFEIKSISLFQIRQQSILKQKGKKKALSP